MSPNSALVDKDGITRTLARGLGVLEALAASAGDDGLTVSELAAFVDLDKATTTRLVQTLCETGYAYKEDRTKRYKITGRIALLYHQFKESLDLPKRAEPYLGKFRDAFDETIHLGVLEGQHVVYIDKLETSRPVKIASAIGHRNPVHSTALGKAILSAMSEAECDELIAQLELTPQTPNTITSRAALKREVIQTAERGYSIDDRENEDSIICVGAPVLDSNGQVIAAISISGPAFRMENRIEELGDACRSTAADLGEAL